MGHYLAGVLGQMQQQIKLLGCQVYRFAQDGDRVCLGIYQEVAGLQSSGGAFRGAAQMGANASQQLLNIERFGHIVVGPCVQGLDLGALVISDGQHNDRNCRLSTDGAADLDTAQAGHHQVGYHQVGQPIAKQQQTLLRIVGGTHVKALRGERGTQHAGNLRLVVDDQNSFRHSLLLSSKDYIIRADGYDFFEGNMQLPSYARDLTHWLAATLIAVAITSLMVWQGVNSTTAGMVFLVLVVWFAAQAGIWLSLYVALLSAVAFDYYFLPPVHSMWIVGIEAWVAMISFLLSCVVVGRLAERARGQARQAEQRSEDVERLYELSQEMMVQEDAAGLIRDLPLLIARIFALDGVVLYVRDLDLFYSSTSDLPMSIQASLRAMALGQNPTLAIPGGFTVRTLMMGLRPVGALGLRPDVLSREVATAVSAQVAIALTRATAIEASSRIEAAREADRLRTALIDSLTHELRTPLTAIRAAATTLVQGEGLDEAGRLELAAIVDEESSRLDRLIGEAVEMAEIDANVVQVHRVPHLPRALLDQAVEESRKALAACRVVIAADDTGNLDKSAWFDPHLLGRVLRHLLENAARHTPAGGRILLSSRRHGDRLEFSIEDDGEGIDASDLPFIFDKFYRGKNNAGKGKGTGMGLAIIRAILAAHGGGIEAESAPGHGACFLFWVPLIEKEPMNRG